MLDKLLSLDTQIFLSLNSLHNETLDPIMVFLSHNYTAMGFLIFLLLGMGFIYFKKAGYMIILASMISFGASDLISSSVLKPGFERLRPCHEIQTKENVHLAGRYCGGKYGFVSSHASNSFAISMLFWLFFRRKSKLYGLLFVYSIMVSYSRIYLGKHYPLDLIAGAGLGMMISYVNYKLFFKFKASSFS